MLVFDQMKGVLVTTLFILWVSLLQWIFGTSEPYAPQGALVPVVDPVKSYPIAVSSSSD